MLSVTFFKCVIVLSDMMTIIVLHQCHGTHRNDTQNNDTQNNDTWPNYKNGKSSIDFN
jgi:hypothetical protein